jgi:exopolysaccharide biosynthesis polyprenyl glycosylphosphotransferase
MATLDKPLREDAEKTLYGNHGQATVKGGVIRQRTPAKSMKEGLSPPYGLQWQRSLGRAVVVVDTLSITLPVAVLVAMNAFHAQTRPDSLILAALLPLTWLVAMNLSRAHEARFLGIGSEEFQRVFNAAMRVVAVIAVTSFLLRATPSRGLVVVVLPLATLLNLLGRYVVRKWLHRQRQRGLYVHRVLLVGHPTGVSELARKLDLESHTGMSVIGCCLESPDDASLLSSRNVPVLGCLDDLPKTVQRHGATAIAVTPTPTLGGAKLRRLVWALEGSNVEILVAPNLTDCVGPRIHIRPVAGLPLLHVEHPEFSGAHRFVKSLFDRCASLLGIVVLSPLLLAIAVAVRVTSPGPAVFRQRRIGRGGREFVLFKFRTMCVDAEERLAELRQHNDQRDGPLFKIRNDPRTTRIGAVLRRYSLDELPQLWNVLRGDMSLVGPRPPLAGEVQSYSSDVRRRLLVPPGLTGLWQISGRSELDWEESVRLDLFYIENWSLALDLMILWKTLPAVVRHSGAY